MNKTGTYTETQNRILDPNQKYITTAHIDLVLSRHFSVIIPDEIAIRCRKRKYVYKRHVGMYLYLQYTKMTLQDIANKFGVDDHTTVIHARHAIKDLMDSDPAVREEIYSLKIKILSMAVPKIDSMDVLTSHYKEVYDLLDRIRKLQKEYDLTLSPITRLSLKNQNEKADKYLSDMGRRPIIDVTQP